MQIAYHPEDEALDRQPSFYNQMMSSVFKNDNDSDEELEDEQKEKENHGDDINVGRSVDDSAKVKDSKEVILSDNSPDTISTKKKQKTVDDRANEKKN